MKVLLVGDYPPPAGGISTHVQQLDRFLQKQGLDTRVLDIGRNGVRSPAEYAIRLASAAAQGFLIHLHTSGNNRKAWLVAASCAWMLPRRAPRVLTIHSGLMPATVGSDSRVRLLARAVAKSFSAVVAVSESVADALRGLGLQPSKLVVQPAFIASAVVPGHPPARLQEIRQRRKTLLAMAHHPSPVYGRAVMFDALKRLEARLPGLGLCLFGPGTREPAFLEDARKAGVEGLIDDLGELEHGEVLAVLAASDLFVRPTLADGDSISVREALALGIPTVASDAASRPAEVVLFRVGNAEDLARAVEQAAALTKSSQRRGALGNESIDSGEAMVRLYRELARAHTEKRNVR